jgi:predicted metal-dependent enzyme (double-stranded beta helix superfamily)
MLADTHNGVAPGCRELVEALDRAAAQPNVDDITRSIQELLSRMAVEGSIALPASLCDPCEDGYARRLIHLSESPLYSVLAMVWGPGQGTSVHDHSGMWCVEGVERVADRCRFQAQESTSAGIGSSGRLIPPFDYHTIRNTGTEECAITIHVYGGEMVECNIFEPAADGWYEERAMQLAYTA